MRRILTFAWLLVLCLATAASADDGQILIDKAHNAAVRYRYSESAEGAQGSFRFLGDFPNGLLTFKVDAKPNEENLQALGNSSGFMHLNVDSALELVGSITVPLGASSPKGEQKIEILAESVLTPKESYARGKLNVAYPALILLPKMSVEGSAEGSAKAFKGSTTFLFNIDKQQARSLPFLATELNISEKGDLTTLKISISLDPKDHYADDLKQMAKKPEEAESAVKDFLNQFGFKVEKVELSEFKDSPGLSASFSITLKDWRIPLASLLTDTLSEEIADESRLKTALSRCLKLKLDNFALKVAVEGLSLKGSLAIGVDHADSFLGGYYDILTMLAQAHLQESDDDTNFAAKLALAHETLVLQEGQKTVEAFSDSGVSYKGSYKLGVTETSAIDGEFNFDFENFASFVSKASAAGLPLGKNFVAKLQAISSDSGRLQVSLYHYSDAPLLDYYHDSLVKSLQKAGAAPELVNATRAVSAKDLAASLTFSSAGVNATGYLQTSSLVDCARALIAGSDQRFTGEPSGFAASGKTAKNQINSVGSFFIAGAMVGQPPEVMKEVLGTDVKEVKPADVNMVSVAKPEISLPASLLAVRADGRKMFDGGISAEVPAVANLTSRIGGRKSLLILGGILGLLVALGLAVKRNR